MKEKTRKVASGEAQAQTADTTGAAVLSDTEGTPRGIRVALHTPMPSLANELCDILKLFFAVEGFAVYSVQQESEAGEAHDGCGTVEQNGDCPNQNPWEEALLHTFYTVNGAWHCTFTFRGKQAQRALTIPADVEEARQAIVYKRLTKRLCKLALYGLLKELTGLHPPWGSLTGIRPTRLVYENLAHGMNLSQAAAALTRDFDVTPEKAELLRRIIQVQRQLPLPRQEEVDVYVSIPFCRTRCAYCSFPGEALGKQVKMDAYLTALFMEMQATADMLLQAGLRLRALYIGGGTPTSLSEVDFARLMERVCMLFPNACECTVEAGRPDTITRNKLETLRRHGVARISINPQTMNDKTLSLIGRDHTAAQTEEAFFLARELGFSNINMDVIVGLPGETEADFSHTMADIVRMQPDSLTVHTLAIKRSSRLNLQGAVLPEAQVAARMVQLGEEAATALGMQPYYLYRQKYMAGQQQNVGYARMGAACLYNIDIMEENTSIMAVGAGAISKRVFPDRELRIERAPNVSNVAVYESRVEEMIQRKQRLFVEM